MALNNLLVIREVMSNCVDDNKTPVQDGDYGN